MAQKRSQSTTHKHPILAGFVTGGMEISITYPIEYIKTQAQIAQERGLPRAERTLSKIFHATWDRYGWRGLYRGLSSNLLFAFPRSSLRFWVFDQVMSRFPDDVGVWGRALGGLCAGVTEGVLVVTPMTTIQVRLIHDLNAETPRFRGLFHGMSVLAKEQGFFGLYRGVVPTVAKIAMNQTTRFVVYGEARGMLEKIGQSNSSASAETLRSLTAGAFAGAVSVCLNQPLDVVKSNMQSLHADRYKGIMDCAAQLYRGGGISALYAGLVPRLIRVCAEVSLTFALFEQISALCNTLIDGDPFTVRSAVKRS